RAAAGGPPVPTPRGGAGATPLRRAADRPPARRRNRRAARLLLRVNYRCSSFHLGSLPPAKRWPLAVEKRFDLHARTREPRHHGADRHPLHLRNLTVSEAFEHHEEERRALILHQRGE